MVLDYKTPKERICYVSPANFSFVHGYSSVFSIDAESCARMTAVLRIYLDAIQDKSEPDDLTHRVINPM
jgi:hypothetical protein